MKLPLRNVLRQSAHYLTGLAVCASLTSGAIFCSTVNASTVYTLQVGAFSLRDNAEKAVLKFGEDASAVHIVEVPDATTYGFKLCYGQFDSYAGAWAAKDSLPSEGTNDGAFVLTYQDDSKEVALSGDKDLFSVKATEFSKVASKQAFVSEGKVQRISISPALLKKSAPKMSKDELLAVGFDASKNKEGVPALEEFLRRHPNDVDANATKMRLSRRLMGRKDYERARKLLDEVAVGDNKQEAGEALLLNGYVTLYEKGVRASVEDFKKVANRADLPGGVRLEAMRRAAGSAHAIGDYPFAWRAFSQLQKVAPSSAERAEAAVQLAGLSLELANSGKGTMDDVRERCDAVAQIDGAPRQHLATASLMHLESYFHEGEYEQALVEAQAFVKNFPDIRREHTLASVWVGVCLVKLRRYDEAQAALTPLLELELASTDKFGGHEPIAKAAYWLGWMAEQKGDNARRDELFRLIQTDYPSSSEAKKVAGRLAQIATIEESDSTKGGAVQ